MKKNILFCLIIMAMSAKAMEQLQDLVCILSVKKIQREEASVALSCVNKRLAVAIPYEYFREHWSRKQYSSPLEQLLLAYDLAKNKPKGNKYLRIAECFLRDGANPNGFCPQFHCHLLDEAAKRQDKDFARLLLRYGANPYLKVSLVGHCSSFNAFHFARQRSNVSFEDMVHLQYERGNEPEGWLLELCGEVEEEKKKK
jgi:hypothetical protein